jgi:DNA repair exonuclease SbcCD ATPase subunit
MLKLFALLSVLLFVFKALATNNNVLSEEAARVQAQVCTIVNEARNHCSSNSSEPYNITGDKARSLFGVNSLSCPPGSYPGCPSDAKSERDICNDKYNKLTEELKLFRKDARTAKKDALENKNRLNDDLIKKQGECSNRLQEIQVKIKEENAKLQKDLREIEKTFSEKDSQTRQQLQQVVRTAKELTAAINRNMGTERTAVYTNFNSELRKLAVDCAKLLADAKKEAQEYLRQRRIGRNSGRLKHRSLNSSFNGNPDKAEAYLKIEDTYEQCEFLKNSLEENRDLALDTLDENLQKLNNDQASLQVELNQINQLLQNSPTEKQKEINQRIQIASDNIQSLTQELQISQTTCSNEMRNISSQIAELDKLQVADKDSEAVESYLQQAKAACCKQGNPLPGIANTVCKDLGDKDRSLRRNGSRRSRSR